MLIERLKQLLSRSPLPAETQRLVDGAGSTSELARKLDKLVTANELEFRTLQKEIEELERREREETERIRSGELGARSRKISLLHIQRLRRQQDGLESRMRIHDQNMNLHLGLLNKMQSLQAMEMRGLQEADIDSVLLDFEEELKDYSRAMEAGTAALRESPFVDAEKDRELAALEKEILGGEAGRTDHEEEGGPSLARETSSPAEGPPPGERTTPGAEKESRAQDRDAGREPKRLPPEAET